MHRLPCHNLKMIRSWLINRRGRRNAGRIRLRRGFAKRMLPV
jgi:hypothetical protein